MQAPDASSQRLDELVAGGKRTKRRLARVLAPVLARVRSHEERLIAAAEAVEVVPWRRRAAFGTTWAFCHRVALIFTDRRLLEVALSPWGRRPTGLVRELSWTSAPQPELGGRSLTIGDAGQGQRWLLRQAPSRTQLTAVKQAWKGQATRGGRSGGAVRPWRLCPGCGVTVTGATGAACRHCGSLWRSRRLAGLLSLAIPGGGPLFLGRPFYAQLRFLLEVACLVLVGDQLLQADSAARTAIVVGIGVVLAVLLKIESMRMTWALASRSGTTNAATVQRWRRLAPVGALLSVLACLAPLLLSGLTGTEITGDLDARVAHLGWTVAWSQDDWGERASDPTMRALWRSSNGLELAARAQPFVPFERLHQAQARLLAAYQARQPEELGQAQLGPHQVIRVVERVHGPTGQQQPETAADQAAGSSEELVRIELLLLDGHGRDAHTLSTEVPGSELKAADRELKRLTKVMFWIDALPGDQPQAAP